MPKQFRYQPWLNSPIESPTLLNLLGISNIHVLSCHYSLANTHPVESPLMQQLLWRPSDSQGRDWVFMESFPPSRLSSYKWLTFTKQLSMYKSLSPFPQSCLKIHITLLTFLEDATFCIIESWSILSWKALTRIIKIQLLAQESHLVPEHVVCQLHQPFVEVPLFPAEKLLLKAFSSIAPFWVLTNFPGFQMDFTIIQVHYGLWELLDSLSLMSY